MTSNSKIENVAGKSNLCNTELEFYINLSSTLTMTVLLVALTLTLTLTLTLPLPLPLPLLQKPSLKHKTYNVFHIAIF